MQLAGEWPGRRGRVESRISRGRGRTRLLTTGGALSGLLLVPVQRSMTVRCWRGMAVGACAVVLSWTLLGTGQAWASGSASHFTRLTGLGQSLDEPRGGAVAATLPYGQVLIAGGNPGSGFLSSARTVQPGDGHVHEAREHAHRSTLRGASRRCCPSGQVLIAGGCNDQRLPLERGTVQPRHGHVHEAHGRAHRSDDALARSRRRCPPGRS